MDVGVKSYIFSKRPAVYVALFFSLLTACGQQGGAGSGGMTTVGVKMTIPSETAASTASAGLQPQAPVPAPVSSVTLSVIAPGGPVVASITVSVEPGQTVTISLEVPSGLARTFIAEASGGGLLLFWGHSEPVGLSPGVP